MTAIFEEVFKIASNFPEEYQEILAKYWIEEMKHPNFIEIIKDEMKWQKTFTESEDVLEILAEKALSEYQAEKAEQIGWDEL